MPVTGIVSYHMGCGTVLTSRRLSIGAHDLGPNKTLPVMLFLRLQVVTTLLLIMLLASVKATPVRRNIPGRNARKVLAAATETADKAVNKNDATCGGPTAVTIWSNGENCCCSADYRGMVCASGQDNEYWTMIRGHPCCCLAN